MGRRVLLDEECCIACGSCAELCPEVFEMDEDAEKAYVFCPRAVMRSALRKPSSPALRSVFPGRNNNLDELHAPPRAGAQQVFGRVLEGSVK
jgi:ferredoxin